MERIRQVLREITVEPIFFFYMLSVWLQFPTTQGLYFEKLCLQQFNDSYFCKYEINNGTNQTEEVEIQAATSQWMFYDTLCLGLPSLVMAPYFGSWSDKISRKIPLVFPPLGAVLGCVNYIIASIYPHQPVGYLLLSSLLNGLSGGFITTILAVFSYVGAVSSIENRGVRVALLESMSFLGGTVGLGISGVLLNTYGFEIVFALLACIHTCVIFYVLLIVPGVRIESTVSRDAGCCRRLFGLGHFKEYIVCMFKPREGVTRRNLLLVVFSLFLVFLCFAGTRDISYLFLKKSPISWDRSLYGYFQAYQNVIFFLFLSIGSPVFKRCLGLSDLLLIIFGLLSTIASSLMLGFSISTWMVFLAPLLGCFHGQAAASSRAFASTLVAPDEQGRLFAFIGSSETVASLLASAIFNRALYPASVAKFAGLSFVVIAAILVISLSLILFVYCSLRTSSRNYVSFSNGTDYGNEAPSKSQFGRSSSCGPDVSEQI